MKAGREPGLREPWLRTGRMMELLGSASRGRLLLVGEAEGLLAGRLSRERAAEVTWFDPSSTGGDGPDASPGTRPPGVFRLQGDPARLPFTDGSFDAVASQFAVSAGPDPRSLLLEWSRVTRPGGVVALACRNALFGGGEPRVPPGNWRAMTPAEIERLLEDCGLKVRRVCTLAPDLKLPRLYRRDFSISYRFERLPWFRDRGMLLFASAVKRNGG